MSQTALHHRLTTGIRSVLALAIFLGIGDAARSDQVWIEPQRPTSTQSDWYPRAIEIHSGKVLKFDNEQLRFQPVGDAEEMLIAATRVLWIEPAEVSDLEADAMQLFAKGEYSSSLGKLPEILAGKPPIWRQQWITMTAAVAAWKSGRADIALELVSQLDRRPLPPIAIAWLPIAWTNRSLPANVVDAANGRLADPSPVVRLVAASWLLSSPERNQAIAILKQLESEDRKEIARFARILSWRAASPPEVLELSGGWEEAIDSLPMVWQTGPLTLLIDKLRTANQIEAASRLRWSLELTPMHPHFDWMGTSSTTAR